MTTLTEPIYTTTDALVAELEAQSAATIPDDAVATRVIEDAEDLIDRLLGGWYWGPNEESGRKVTQGDVMDYQWNKLGRATTKLAARLYIKPDVLDQVYTMVSGPDFSFSGPRGGALVQLIGTQVLAILDDSGLRRVAGRARAGRGCRYPVQYERWRLATRHDGT